MLKKKRQKGLKNKQFKNDLDQKKKKEKQTGKLLQSYLKGMVATKRRNCKSIQHNLLLQNKTKKKNYHQKRAERYYSEILIHFKFIHNY